MNQTRIIGAETCTWVPYENFEKRICSFHGEIWRAETIQYVPQSLHFAIISTLKWREQEPSHAIQNISRGRDTATVLAEQKLYYTPHSGNSLIPGHWEVLEQKFLDTPHVRIMETESPSSLHCTYSSRNSHLSSCLLLFCVSLSLLVMNQFALIFYEGVL